MITALLAVFFGALNVSCAISFFKEKAYFKFGLEVFLAIWMAAIVFAKVVENYT